MLTLDDSPVEVTDSTALYDSDLVPSLLSWPKNGAPEETTQRCWNWSQGMRHSWGKLCLLGNMNIEAGLQRIVSLRETLRDRAALRGGQG